MFTDLFEPSFFTFDLNFDIVKTMYFFTKLYTDIVAPQMYRHFPPPPIEILKFEIIITRV